MATPEDPLAEEFELRLLFFREVQEGYLAARDAQERFLRAPSDFEAVEKLGSFFHRIAGTAQTVGQPLLGCVAAMAERVAERTARGAFREPQVAARLFSDALAGVAMALDAHGAAATERPLVPVVEEFGGLVVPDSLGEGREFAKILVVDDDRFSAEMIDGCLRSAGFMSAYTCSSEHALALIAAELPDLIVLDVAMPGLDGFELCRRVREHPALQFTPIIFVTRKSELEQRVRGLEVGGNDYIAKPFEPQELVARVRSHLVRLAALREMAIRDGLTRCYNHKFFHHRLTQEMSRSERYEQPVVLAMLDIDRFKGVNDRYGHRAGDNVLSHLGSVIAASVRATDVVARYGGEEFAMLMVQAGAAEARIVCDRLRARLAAHPFEVPDGDGDETVSIAITVSIGVAELVHKKDTVESLVGRADRALYAAKEAGRDCVRFAEPPS